jgi:hypothetical protein
MAAETPCIYKSVTMSAGETFVLPPGAEIISVSDLGAITNSCPDPLPTEELSCYRISWVLNIDPEGSKTVPALVTLPPFGGGLGTAVVAVPNTGNAWEDGDGDTAAVNIDKVSIAGTVVSAGVQCADFTALEAVIAGSSVGGILSDRKYNFYDTIQPLTVAEQAMWGSWWQSGFRMYTMHFKSIPTLAATVYLEFVSALNADGGNIGSIPRYFAQEVDCLTYPTTTL